jgi:hypothetical protein
MHPTNTDLAIRLIRRVRESEVWMSYPARRQHGQAMAEPPIAAEHHVQIARYEEHERGACRFSIS